MLPAFATALLFFWVSPDQKVTPLPQETKSRAEWRWPADSLKPVLHVWLQIPGEEENEIDVTGRTTPVRLPDGRQLVVYAPVQKTEVLVHPVCTEHGLTIRAPLGMPAPKDPPLFLSMYCDWKEGQPTQAVVMSEPKDPIEEVEIDDLDVRASTQTLEQIDLGPQVFGLIQLAGFRKAGRQKPRRLHFDVRVAGDWIQIQEPASSETVTTPSVRLGLGYLPWTGRWDFFASAGSAIKYSDFSLGAGYRLSSHPGHRNSRLLAEWQLVSLHGFRHGPSLGYAWRSVSPTTRRELTAYGKAGIWGGLSPDQPTLAAGATWTLVPLRGPGTISLGIFVDFRWARVLELGAPISLLDGRFGISTSL